MGYRIVVQRAYLVELSANFSSFENCTKIFITPPVPVQLNWDIGIFQVSESEIVRSNLTNYTRTDMNQSHLDRSNV